MGRLHHLVPADHALLGGPAICGFVAATGWVEQWQVSEVTCDRCRRLLRERLPIANRKC